MRFPDKITSYEESTLGLLPLILNELNKRDMTPTELFAAIKTVNPVSLSEYFEALDCLFALGKIELHHHSEVLHYVA